MKRKNFLQSNGYFNFIWAAFHLIVAVLFIMFLFRYRGFHFDSDLFEMMPSSTSAAARIADKNISESTSRSVFILAGHQDFSRARQAAVSAYDRLSTEFERISPKFSELELYVNSKSVSEVMSFLKEWRFNLLDRETAAILSDSNSAREFAENRIARITSLFTFVTLDSLNEDPFLFDELNLEAYESAVEKSGTAMQPKSGVLASCYEGVWYVMIRGTLSEEGASLSSTNAVPLIYDTCSGLETDGVRFVYSGTPFHSYKSSRSASSEMSLIGTLSLILVAVILFFVFHSVRPVIACVFSIALSVLTAVWVTFIVFGKIHALTLVFGTSLIGSCIDYSLHFFINWKNNIELKDGSEIRRKLFKGLSLSLLSTEICYFFLMFAPFAMLKQMAVFSFTGILSSFLTVTGLFANFKVPAEEKRNIKFLQKINFVSDKKIAGRIFRTAVFAFSAVIIFVNRDSLSIKNDLTNLYKVDGRLKEDAVLAYKILDYSPSSWFVVSGSSEEEVLQKEEKLLPQIQDSCVCTSMFIPSMEKQMQSINALKALDDDVLDFQFDFFGYGKDEVQEFKNAVTMASGKFLTPSTPCPESLSSLLKMLWIGEVDGTYYSVILLSSSQNGALYKNLAEEQGIFFENKVSDVSGSLDSLTGFIFIMFAAAYVVIIAVLKIFYSFRQTLKIAAVPLLSVLSITAVFLLSGIRIEFFCATGMILVFGLGLDYIIYSTEHVKNNGETFAIMLSFVTTAVSFGALAFSSFVPVHVIGLSIFTGLTTAFLCTVL